MKRTIFIMMAAVALGFMGCDRQTNAIQSVDMVVLKHGQIQLYDHASKQLVPYEAETDSVVNIAFDNNNHLFYTTANQQDLKLKMIDLTNKNSKPTLCADWQLTLRQVTDDMWGTGACLLATDKDRNNLYIMSQSPYEENIDVECYNIASGKAGTMSSSEYWENYDGVDRYGSDLFYNGDGSLYYVTPEGKYCLTDQIDFMALFDYEDCMKYLHFYPLDLSPDDKQVVIKANCEWGELDYGYHCLATLDGKQQSVLTDSDLQSFYPEWLSDGSLVYVGQEPRPQDDPYYDAEWNVTRHCIKILAPDGTASVLVSDAEEFYFNPKSAHVTVLPEEQAPLKGCDKVSFDNGKVTFCNSSTNESIPFDAEKNYVINGVFYHDYGFLYTVAIGDELYLKEIGIEEYPTRPEMRGDWGLKLGDCYSESCDKTASMELFETIMDDFAYVLLTKLEFGMDEQSCAFQNARYFNGYYNSTTDGWPENCVIRKD